MDRKVRTVHKIPIGLTKPREEGMNPAKPGSTGSSVSARQTGAHQTSACQTSLARPGRRSPSYNTFISREYLTMSV